MASSNSLPDDSTNVKWMYEGVNSTIDREAYLLGKRITKAPEDKGDFIVENASNENLSVSVLERLDYESKVREDPLFNIKKKENERRRELLSNPVKRKRLQSALKNALLKDLESHKKTHHKSSEKRKRKRQQTPSSSSDSSDSSSTDSSDGEQSSKKLLKSAHKDKELHAALKKALEKDLKNQDISSSESEEERHEKTKKHTSHKKHKHDSNRKSHHPNHNKSPSSSYRSHNNKPEKSRDNPTSETEKPKKEGYGLIVVKSRSTSQVKHKRKTPSPEPVKEKYVRKHKSGFTRKLTKDELEQKRRDMMDNAGWRDEQRKKNVKHYTNQEKIENEREAHIQKLHDKQLKERGKVKTFLHDMKLKQASGGSLEDTVKRKRHTLDRRSRD